MLRVEVLASLVIFLASSCRCRKIDPQIEARRSARSELSTVDCWDPNLDLPKKPWGSRPFCPKWPPYNGQGRGLRDEDKQSIRDSALRAVKPFARGMQSSHLQEVAKQHCVQRLCMHVQIISREIYLVAPLSKRCKGTSDPASLCSLERRAATPGLRPSGYNPKFNPSDLEWHFYAGLNMSDCTATTRHGDWNGPYTRLRMMSALRLMEEAARYLPDLELIWCANECPVNAGGWCLQGPQPIFSSTTNEEHAQIAFPHWMPNLRDWDFWIWDEARRNSRKFDLSQRQDVAVFRGGLYRMNVYSDDWRAKGVKRIEFTPENWRQLGRPALLQARLNEGGSKVLNVNFKAMEFNNWAEPLRISNDVLKVLDAPETMQLSEQQEKFRYTVNVEGHGGWADRLYRLLMSPQLVIAQDLPFRLWYESFLKAGKTHLIVDSNFRNLSAVVMWAQQHPQQVDEMVAAANAATSMSTSVAGIRMYVRQLLTQYAKLFKYPPELQPRAIRFKCEPSPECRQCQTPTKPPQPREVCGTRCTFRVGDERYDTLHQASHSLSFKPKEDGAKQR